MESVQWNGREVENPILRPLVAFCAMALGFLGAFVGLVVAILAIPLSLIAAVVGLAVAAILIPLTWPLHLLLRVLGRKGFLTTGDGRFSYTVDLKGFRRAR